MFLLQSISSKIVVSSLETDIVCLGNNQIVFKIMIYLIIIAFSLILLFYKIFVIKVPSNFPPGPRLKIPILGISLEEAYRLFLDQDEIEKHKDYRKK